MPALPWIRSSDEPPDDAECVAMASRLPLAHYRHIPVFLRAAMAIRSQLARTDGLLGYALDADLVHKTFWTVSAWRDREALNGFNRADPHHSSVRRIRPRMHPTTFVFWTCHPTDLPIRWDEVHRRIAETSIPGGADPGHEMFRA